MALIQIKRGTAAQWATANPILAEGEPGAETDTGLLKVGTGGAGGSGGGGGADLTDGSDGAGITGIWSSSIGGKGGNSTRTGGAGGGYAVRGGNGNIAGGSGYAAGGGNGAAGSIIVWEYSNSTASGTPVSTGRIWNGYSGLATNMNGWYSGSSITFFLTNTNKLFLLKRRMELT